MATDPVLYLQRLHEHRAWVNNNLLAAAAGVDEARLHEPFPIGQGSVWKSLTHMFAAEYVWLETLLGDQDPVAPGDKRGHLPGNQLGEDAMASLAELSSRWQQLAERWKQYLATLTPGMLDRCVCKIVRSRVPEGELLETQCADVVLHVALHAHYTAAQTVNMFRHLGVQKLPDTMLIALARQQSAGLNR